MSEDELVDDLHGVGGLVLVGFGDGLVVGLELGPCQLARCSPSIRS